MKFLPLMFISFLTIRDILASFVKTPVVILILRCSTWRHNTWHYPYTPVDNVYWRNIATCIPACLWLHRETWNSQRAADLPGKHFVRLFYIRGFDLWGEEDQNVQLIWIENEPVLLESCNFFLMKRTNHLHHVSLCCRYFKFVFISWLYKI